MQATGIIVEYNPFHHGHLYHLQQAKALAPTNVLVAVMSGNFVQRGEPAIIDKWARTKQALQAGVDLVIELPFIYTNQSARQFASGAIKYLELLQVSQVVFGSETNNLAELQEISSLKINPDNFKDIMKQGYAYPKAYGLLASHIGPNDILAISYLQALVDTTIKPRTILRVENDYHDQKLTGPISSATAIRQALLNKQSVHAQTPMSEVLTDQQLLSLSDYYPFISHQLITNPNLAQIALMSEGIENQLRKNALQHFNYFDFLAAAVSKRYTKARINRILVNVLVNLTKTELQAAQTELPLRVLGFSTLGQAYLHQLKAQTELAFLTSLVDLPPLSRAIETKVLHAYLLPLDQTNQIRLKKREFLPPIII